MNLYNESKLMNMVAKQQSGAKGGTLKLGKEVYVFTFNQERDFYEITLNGELETNVKERSLNKAKAWFKNYMEN